MATNKGFSDRLSPEILCDWLATRLEANGLELKEEQRHILLGTIKVIITPPKNNSESCLAFPLERT